MIRNSIFVLAALAFMCCEARENEPSAPKGIQISGTLPVFHIETESRKPIVSKEVS